MMSAPGNKERIHLKDLSPEAFEAELACSMDILGQPAFRMKQIRAWLYKKGVDDFDGMTDLSAPLARLLKNKYAVTTLQQADVMDSRDGSRKILWRLRDGLAIESVMLPTAKGLTFCVSTQVGCPMGCVFCETGRIGFKRNLTVGEIVDQVIYLRRDAASKTSPNIVFMGMGEPFLNFSSLITALEIITGADYLGIGERRVTVSTIGLPEQIRAFADLGTKVRLAVSLNAATDRQRAALMPAAASHPVKDVLAAVAYYYRKTGIRVSLEYVVLPDVNASVRHASQLAGLLKGFPVKLNLITYNPAGEKAISGGSEEETLAFAERIRKQSALCVTVRKSLGGDIRAACGQLAAGRRGNNSRGKRHEA
jgi:23S rRNA (adenine2503-C2)-methyltransferase